VGYHNKYLLGSLESNIITGRALAKTKNVRGGSWGARVRARWGAAAHLPPSGYAYVSEHFYV